jgi:hypothetical protein
MQMVIDPHGQVHFIYAETLDLTSLGELTIRRVSCVEPEGSGWYADLSPVKGPLFGPFPFRSQALQAEIVWLEKNLAALSRQPTVDAA